MAQKKTVSHSCTGSMLRMPKEKEPQNGTSITLPAADVLDALNTLDCTLHEITALCQEITALCQLLLTQLPATGQVKYASTSQLPSDSFAIILQIICDKVQIAHTLAEIPMEASK